MHRIITGLDIMICNAGVADIRTMVNLRDMQMDDYMNTFNLNFFCPVVMTKEALPHLEKTKGNIVHVSSIVGMFQNGLIPIFQIIIIVYSSLKSMWR